MIKYVWYDHSVAGCLYTTAEVFYEGRLTEDDAASTLHVKLVKNAMAFLFYKIRYELTGVGVNTIKNAGITSNVKTLLSANDYEKSIFSFSVMLVMPDNNT